MSALDSNEQLQQSTSAEDPFSTHQQQNVTDLLPSLGMKAYSDAGRLVLLLNVFFIQVFYGSKGPYLFYLQFKPIRASRYILIRRIF